MRRLVAGAALLALLGGCGKEISTPATRPALERPVLTLSTPVGEHRKLFVPRQALVERAGISGVFVLVPISETATAPSLARGPRLGPIGEARFRLVKAGRARDGQLEILSGLHGDETLVLGDLGAVHDGSPITTVKSAK